MLEYTPVQRALYLSAQIVHCVMGGLVGRDARMEFPHGVGGQGPFLTDIAMHQFHGSLVVLEHGNPQVGFDVGILSPDQVSGKTMLQQRRGSSTVAPR